MDRFLPPQDGPSSEGVPQGWQPPETAPMETDVLVLVHQLGGAVRHAVAGRFQAWNDGPVGWYSFEQPERELEVIGWMPLPAATGATS